MVKRNDEITLEEVEELYTTRRLRSIVISPGPGHPQTDSGISRDVIKWAMGKVPLLGVCMGLECVVDVMGGEIAYAGEILHGKTSLVQHDALGIFRGLPPLLPSTRYHSLSANILSLPPLLQVSATTSESGVIMGVRHRQYTIEAVQYHPESVLSEGGREILGNFLKLRGGEWGGVNAWCGIVSQVNEESISKNGVVNGSTNQLPPAPSIPTILNTIHQQRLVDIASAENTPATTSANLQRSIALHAAPPVTPLLARLTQTLPSYPAVMAEIKRASPSKGDISPLTNAPEQAMRYALAGASVISVLTEPKWFKGALSDLLAVRTALASLPNRPALLRKDFILSTYQIDEARIHGADTVLLIVAMLDVATLRKLYAYSCSLGMEPLVEVNNAEELGIALDIGSKVIGVNNRNLHDFKVDMQTTSRLADVLRERGREDVVMCALSGISSRSDVETYVGEGVKAVLVGEALMRAEDPRVFMRQLLGLPVDVPEKEETKRKPLVKICGIQTLADAQAAEEAGADMIGLIFAPTRRQIQPKIARQIATHLRNKRYPNDEDLSFEDLAPRADPLAPQPWFASSTSRITASSKPLLVGVFQNQPLAYIQAVAAAVPLDVVQLHGNEPAEWATQISVPVIKAFHVTGDGSIRGGQVDRPGYNELILLDAAGQTAGTTGGGEGRSFDWSVAVDVVKRGESGSSGRFELPIILAGGLNPDNVSEAVAAVRPWCVDVSSGVENEDGKTKDASRIAEFIKRAKAA